MIPPIIVASKGRPGGKTFELLNESSLPYLVFVEPQDADAYAEHSVVRVLPEDNQGLGYVRQQILEYARAANLEWYWLLDDDITGFYEAVGGKCIRRPAGEILGTASDTLTAIPFLGQGGLEYQQFAWSNEAGKIARNSYCDVAVLIRSDVLVDFRPETNLKVDRDFTLQVLASGMETARTGWLAFAAPTNGSNNGGLAEEYAAENREMQDSLKLETLWPGVVEFKRKPNGRPDAKIHWRRLRKSSGREILT